MANEKEMPVILVNDAFGDFTEQFVDFLQTLDQQCVFLFDEFEKSFDESDQESLLSVLDGAEITKSLFLFVANDRYRINEFMFNRPGRIYYRFEFSGLQSDFIREFIEDNLKDSSKIESCFQLCVAFQKLNFDMLKAVVEEINRYGEQPAEAIKLLNVELNYNENRYNIFLLENETETIVMEDRWFCPLDSTTYVKLKGDNHDYFLSPDKLININSVDDIFIYNSDGKIFKAEKALNIKFNFNAF